MLLKNQIWRRSFLKVWENSKSRRGRNFSTIYEHENAISGLRRHVFDTYKNSETDQLNVGQLFAGIEKSGIRRTDTRLNGFINNLQKINSKQSKFYGGNVEYLNIDYETFVTLFDHDNNALLYKIFKNDLIIPDFPSFCETIGEIYDKCNDNRSGKIASYIPQLSRHSPDTWALSLCTVHGQRFSLGDVNSYFTLQSCSKPFTYAYCLNELGPEIVHKYVSYEPSGKNFNEICLDHKSKPHNPMLNSGAIMSTALIMELIAKASGSGLAEKFECILQYIKRMAGHEHIGFNNSVFLSERQTADRNFSMAYYMKEQKCFPGQVKLQEVMDLYFQTCSMEVNTEAMSVMGATLANGGICPTTDELVVSPGSVRDVLSLMYSCGMYNYSGEFAFTVGLPAKSGVSGALILVVPNVLSIALWSPPLDDKGNTVRGVQFAQELVEIFNFHRFDNLRHLERKKDPRKLSEQVHGSNLIERLYAASYGDTTKLLRHYYQGDDMNEGDYDGRTALHLAAADGQLNAVKLLLKQCNVNPDPKDRWGQTPLEEAQRVGHTEIVTEIKKHLEK